MPDEDRKNIYMNPQSSPTPAAKPDLPRSELPSDSRESTIAELHDLVAMFRRQAIRRNRQKEHWRIRYLAERERAEREIERRELVALSRVGLLSDRLRGERLDRADLLLDFERIEDENAALRCGQPPVTDKDLHQAAREILARLCDYTVCEPDNTEAIDLALAVIEHTLRPLAGRPRLLRLTREELMGCHRLDRDSRFDWAKTVDTVIDLQDRRAEEIEQEAGGA